MCRGTVDATGPGELAPLEPLMVEEISTVVAAPSSRNKSEPSASNRKSTLAQSAGALSLKSKSMPITGGSSASTTLATRLGNPVALGNRARCLT